jgi:hypothetical protein
MAKTLGDGLLLLKELLSSPPTGGHFDDPELIKYINIAQQDVALVLPDELLRGLKGVQNWGVLPDQETSLAHPTDYMRYVTGYRLENGATRKRKVNKITSDELTDMKVNYPDSSGMLTKTYISDIGNSFEIYPPASEDEVAVVTYVKMPTDMALETDEFSVTDLAYKWVIYLAGFLACLKDFQARASSFRELGKTSVDEASAIYRFKPFDIFASIPTTQPATK